MFWTSGVNGYTSKQSLTVFCDVVGGDGEAVKDKFDYPFCVNAKRGNGHINLYLSYEEANALAFQLNAQLQEVERGALRDELNGW